MLKIILVSKLSCIGGGIMVLSNFFCLTGPKNFVGEPFDAVSRKISGSQKVIG